MPRGPNMTTDKPAKAEAAGEAFLGQVQTLLNDLRQGDVAACACCGRSDAAVSTAAHRLGIGASVVRRRINAPANLTLRSLAETVWAFGWEPRLTLRRRADWRQPHRPRAPEDRLKGEALLRHRAQALRAALTPDDPLAAALDAALQRWS